MWTIDTPESIGLDPERWQTVLDLLDDWCRQDRIPSAGLVVGRSGKTTGVHLFGRQRTAAGSPPVRDDAIFLVASITKPLVATAALMLVERAQLALGDRVHDFLPEFGQNGKYGVTVRHLLTHTSGLPDMLPNNIALRAEGAPLARFVEGTCEIGLDFNPGRGVQYQSMGFAVLGELIARISGKPCAQFLRDEIFEPLGMHDTALGAPDEWFTGPSPKSERIAEIRLPEEQQQPAWAGQSCPADDRSESTAADDRSQSSPPIQWHWNSRYWRTLGAPWGGLLTTPADLARFAELMLGRGRVGSTRLLSPAAIAAATRNQLAPMREVPEEDRRCRPWGLGWRLNWPAHSANFGDLLGPATYGHWGATGTALWIDPDRDTFAVILTTQPQEPDGRHLARVSNAIAAGFN